MAVEKVRRYRAERSTSVSIATARVLVVHDYLGANQAGTKERRYVSNFRSARKTARNRVK